MLIFLMTGFTVNAGIVITDIRIKKANSMNIETAKFEATTGNLGQILKIETLNKRIMGGKLRKINNALRGRKLEINRNKKHLYELISSELIKLNLSVIKTERKKKSLRLKKNIINIENRNPIKKNNAILNDDEAHDI